jgi:excisionase family DNA binding protein
LLTVREAAARLGVCTALVYRACAAGELRHTRIGSVIRIAPEDLAAFVARGSPG